MRKTEGENRVLVNNLMWFAGSLALAFCIWIVATLESDPIRERVFPSISVQVVYDDGLLITDQSRSTVSVNVRGPESSITQLSSDDIQVQADLSGRGPNSYRVDLTPIVSRRVVADTSPRQITVTLEEAREQLVEVQANVTESPPRGYQLGGTITFEANQVLVSGPVSLVQQVIAAQVDLDLSQQRNTYSADSRLVAVDTEGNEVDGVTLDPALVRVTVPIQARTDIREVRVIPSTLDESLPDGYAITSISAAPDTIVITGPPDILENAPGAFFTEPVDLTGRTSSFEQDVSVEIPNDDLIVVGNQTITVSIGITPLLASRQFDSIPVEIIGVGEGLRAEAAPTEVTVLLAATQQLLDDLEPANLRVVVDVNGLEAGNYQLMPDVSVTQNQSAVSSVSVLPAEIDVVITEQQAESP
ncbi:MAG: hypothetical protein K8L99_17415 [Anaerolineae bacterium]|nr:hypothetical protein [Anaerolineae bacterium]